MRVNFFNIFFFFFALIAGISAIPANAQYENDPAANELKELSQYPELNLSGEKVLLYEHDAGKVRDSSSTHQAVRATPAASVKVKSAETVKPSAAKEDDDALSFNFLYYIIQKFKISDLVDE